MTGAAVMLLYLLRHGIAEDHAPSGSDADRALTAEGRRKLALVLERAAAGGVRPDAILTSPYVRAVQTAQAAADALNPKKELVKVTALTPEGTPEGVWDALRDYREMEQVLMAGHEPLLSQLTGFLLNCPALQVEMKKAAMVALELNAWRGHPHGVLRWMLTPALATPAKKELK